MIGVSAGDIIDMLTRLGVPAGLAVVGLAFLILYMRSERSRASEPPWVSRLEGEMRQMRQTMESSQRACERTIEANERQMDDVRSMVQECRTILRIIGGHGHSG